MSDSEKLLVPVFKMFALCAHMDKSGATNRYARGRLMRMHETHEAVMFWVSCCCMLLTAKQLLG